MRTTWEILLEVAGGLVVVLGVAGLAMLWRAARAAGGG